MSAQTLPRAGRLHLRPRLHLALGIDGTIAAAVLVVLALVAILASVLAPVNPLTTDLLNLNGSTSASHLLGTDSNGRDLVARLMYGARTALMAPLLVVLLATTFGVVFSLLAAWSRGWVDSLISRLLDIVFAFPGLLLAILAVAVFGKGLMAATIALAISYTPYIGRIVRGGALRALAQPYIAAVRSNGFNGLHITIRHVLPNLAPLVLSQASVLFGYAMIDLAAISFLGLGVQEPTPDWGAMIASGTSGILAGYPQEALYAGALIVLTVACVNLLADRIGDQAGMN